jgi:hypothetical protein
MAQGGNQVFDGTSGLRRISAILGEIGRMPQAAVRDSSAARVRAELFLTSFAILFFELACIRWVPAYVRYLSYFMNFLLLASFLGIGAGILASRRARLWVPPFPVMLFALVATVAANRFELRINSLQVLYYAAGEATASAEHYVVLPLIFTLVALAFVPLARPLGRLLTALPPLQAYAIDILGSMAGVATFFGMSYLGLPPVVWFALLALALVPLMRPRHLLLALPFLLATLFVVFQLGRDST